MGSNKITWLWQQVEEARADHDSVKAKESLTRLLGDSSISSTPDENLAVLELSRLEMDCGNITDAAKLLADFKWYGVPGAAALLLAADVFLRLDIFETSLESLESYLKIYPKDIDALRKKGLVLMMLHKDEESERILLSVARREKYRIPATLTYLALLEAKANRLEESLHLLLQAKELAPYDEKIEHSLLRIEALRIQMRRKAVNRNDLPLTELVPGMTAGMLGLHGYSKDKARIATEAWSKYCVTNMPVGRKPEAWAAALEYAVTRSGPHYTQEQLAGEYGVSLTQLSDHYQLLKQAIDFSSSSSFDNVAAEGADLLRNARMEEVASVLVELGKKTAKFSGIADAAAWVFEQVTPVDDIQRREIEEFVAYIWRKKGYTDLG